MRYENIYSSFPCPASGHFSAASSRVGEFFSSLVSRREKIQLLFSMVCIFSFNYPDAGRIAPISACVFLQRVSSNLKCNKNDRAFDANFEHPTCKGKSITMGFGLLLDSNNL